MAHVILVVEDQPAVQRNIQVGLEMSGYQIVGAANGIEAPDAFNCQFVGTGKNNHCTLISH